MHFSYFTNCIFQNFHLTQTPDNILNHYVKAASVGVWILSTLKKFCVCNHL